jgi:hypothetical protein
VIQCSAGYAGQFPDTADAVQVNPAAVGSSPMIGNDNHYSS